MPQRWLHYDWKLVWHQLSWDKENKLPWRLIQGELSFYKFTVWLLCKTRESLYLTNRQQFSLVSTFVDHRNDVKLFKTQVEHCKVLQKNRSVIVKTGFQLHCFVRLKIPKCCKRFLFIAGLDFSVIFFTVWKATLIYLSLRTWNSMNSEP